MSCADELFCSRFKLIRITLSILRRIKQMLENEFYVIYSFSFHENNLTIRSSCNNSQFKEVTDRTTSAPPQSTSLLQSDDQRRLLYA